MDLALHWNYVDSIRGWMTEEECKWLNATAAGVASWTEVGVCNGRSMVATGLGLPKGALLQVVDSGFSPLFYDSWRYLKSHRPDIRLVAAEMTSRQASRMLCDTAVVFVDADHAYDFVLEDIELWGKKCLFLCGHDYEYGYEPGGHQGVVKAVNELIPDRILPAGSIWLRP